MTVELYDPLTYDNLMAGMVLQFEKQPLEPLKSIEIASGPGITLCSIPETYLSTIR